MAIYHLRMKAIARCGGRLGIGRSAVACAAYRAGVGLKDSKTEQLKDYSYREDVEDTMILAPEGAPEWVYDREKLWNQVEASEKRVDSRFAREIEVALPKELNEEQRRELITEFVQSEFVERGMVADVALHSPNSITKNPHAHIMLTTREITPEGFGKKVRDWDRRELLLEVREGWQIAANQHLERAGVEAQIDHRSIAAQRQEALERGNYDLAIELFRPPSYHKGPRATHIERKGLGSSEKVKEIRKQRTAELAAYAEIRKEAKELLAIVKSNTSQMPLSVRGEIREMEKDLSRLLSERRSAEWDLRAIQPEKDLKKQVVSHERQEEKPAQKPPEQKEHVKVDPLERARVDRSFFIEFQRETERKWNDAVNAEREAAKKDIEDQLKPDIAKLSEKGQLIEQNTWLKNETKKDSRKISNIFARAGMKKEVKRLDGVLVDLKQERKEIRTKIAERRSEYVVQQEQWRRAHYAHPELVQLRSALVHIQVMWQNQDRKLQQQRGLEDPWSRGPHLGLSLGYPPPKKDRDQGVER